MVKKVFIGLLFILLFYTNLYGDTCKLAKIYFQQAFSIQGEDLPELIQKEYLYSHAIELCPSYAEAHNNLGDVYERQGRFEEAIMEYQKAITIKPYFPTPYFGIGDIFFKTNRYSDAIQWYEKGLKYDPEDISTKERVAILNQVKEGKIIESKIIKEIFQNTRGVGDVTSLTFREDLIPFDFNKSEIREDAKPQLNEIGKALKEIFSRNYELNIEIAGHTDIRGSDEYNLLLSWKRAESVLNYLIKHFDLPRERMIAKGYGKRVNLCKESTEACHALNRRVAIIKKDSGSKNRVRGESLQNKEEIGRKKLIMDLGFFYQKEKSHSVKVLKEGTLLRSKSDKYFIFLRPFQDCFAYLIQEDYKGKIDLLFPKHKNDSSKVRRGHDYWIPSFGKAFTLDEVTGEEKLYLLVTSWPLGNEIERLLLERKVKGIIQTLQSRAIKIIKSSNPYETLPEEELYRNPLTIESLLERIEGEGGWV